MDMRQEIDAQVESLDANVAGTPARPSRPGRPQSARPSARPMMLNSPIVAPDEAADLAAAAPAPKAKRPARPAPVQQMERPERPKTSRRARVLDPDQVAASRGETPTPPRSDARDAALGADTEEEMSKIGGVVQSFQQIATRLKASKSEATPVQSSGEEVQAEVQEDAVPSNGVLGSLRGLVARSRKDVDEDAGSSVPEFEFTQDPDETAYDYATDYGVESAAVYMAPKPSILARFDTPVMGVLAAILVSCGGFVGASALIG